MWIRLKFTIGSQQILQTETSNFPFPGRLLDYFGDISVALFVGMGLSIAASLTTFLMRHVFIKEHVLNGGGISSFEFKSPQDASRGPE